MTNPPIARMNAGKKAMLAIAGLSTVIVPFAIGILQAPTGHAQSVDTITRKFEVASVKPCTAEPDTGNQRRLEYRTSPGMVEIECLTLERIIYFAYADTGNMSNPLFNDHPGNAAHVRGGPGWIRSDRFNIDAIAEGSADRPTMMGPVLRTLLEDRFHLKLHRETEEVPLYVLTAAKGGIKMQPIDADGCIPANSAGNPSDVPLMSKSDPNPICGSFHSSGDGVNKRWLLGGETLKRFANGPLSSVVDRYVLDQTGVSGLFNIALEFGLDDSIATGVFGGGRAADPPPDVEKAASIFQALPEQLGLKLEKTRGPHEYLLVDSVERPPAN